MLAGRPVASSPGDRSFSGATLFAGLFDFLGHWFPHRDEGYVPSVLGVELFGPFSQVAPCKLPLNASAVCPLLPHARLAKANSDPFASWFDKTLRKHWKFGSLPFRGWEENVGEVYESEPLSPF